jgi:hypothetical protein
MSLEQAVNLLTQQHKTIDELIRRNKTQLQRISQLEQYIRAAGLVLPAATTGTEDNLFSSYSPPIQSFPPQPPQPPIFAGGSDKRLQWNMGTTSGIVNMPILFQGQVRAPVSAA